ncbi:eukaryotic translation initiation factor 4E-binding protein 2-like [Sebastes fasciatus]|uniref:eukaryotic translation initiation factor 4E-binding protein 2-like n=1 Tax=Sebastes fasciatus TaxID=394691 RepID=UPI003D9DFE33
MSAGGKTTSSRDIPAVRRVTIHDAAHMPQDYSTTPGGTLFSTTPGGTRIIYDRKFLLQCRTSPLARTPPNLPDIPGVTTPLKTNDAKQPEQTLSNSTDHSLHRADSADDQFEMDI